MRNATLRSQVMLNPNCTALFAGVGKYPASGGLNGLAFSDQPLGRLLSRSTRWRHACFTHALNCPLPAIFSIFSKRSSSKRMFFIVLFERSNLCFEVFSCIGRYLCCMFSLSGTYQNKSKQLNIAKLGGASTPAEPLTKPLMGVTVMAEHQHTQTRPKFTDTYWIIPEYETTPYGKVSFTRQARRTFIAMFKDSRLIWAGRKPVLEVAHG